LEAANPLQYVDQVDSISASLDESWMK